jgi:ABC-type antimicrobial peptide transport system permease subunit
MAIGAQRADIVRMVVRDAAWLLVWSLAIGIPMAIIALRVTADTLFGVTAHDPLTFTLSAIVLTALTLIAAYVPSRRASRIDPLQALRIE